MYTHAHNPNPPLRDHTHSTPVSTNNHTLQHTPQDETLYDTINEKWKLFTCQTKEHEYTKFIVNRILDTLVSFNNTNSLARSCMTANIIMNDMHSLIRNIV